MIEQQFVKSKRFNSWNPDCPEWPNLCVGATCAGLERNGPDWVANMDGSFCLLPFFQSTVTSNYVSFQDVNKGRTNKKVFPLMCKGSF